MFYYIEMDKNILYRFFEGTATDNEIRLVKLWLESSDTNREELFRERKIFDAMILNNYDPAPKEKYTERRTLTIVLKEIAKVAAAVFITILVFSYIDYLKGKSEKGLVQTISVPAGQRTNVTLPDGTNVWLNARTTLSYAADFGLGNRDLKLDGEAYFDVTPNKDLPFIVETSKGKIKVLGTQFNIMDYSENPYYEAALMEGKLELEMSSSENKTLLLPGNKAVFKNERLEVSRVEDYEIYRWREGLICFRNQTFETIVKEFEKYYGVQIVVDNEDIKKTRYTGKFRQSDGVNYALYVLRRDIYFEFIKDDERNVIYIK